MIYVVIPFDEIENPQEEGLFEFVNGSYTLSEDSEPNEEKTYFEEYSDDAKYTEFEVEEDDDPSMLGLYVKIGGTYVLTEDEEPVSGTVYYEFYDPNDIEDDELYYPVDASTITNPSEEGLYEEDDDGTYVMTDDTVPDPSKTYYRSEYDDDAPDEDLVEYEVDEYPTSGTEDLLEKVFGTRNLFTQSSTSGKTPYLLSSCLYAYVLDGDNPHDLGYLERSSLDEGVGILTDDTVPQPGKPYFRLYQYSDYVEEDLSRYAEASNFNPNNPPSGWEPKFDPTLASKNYYVLNGDGQYVLANDTVSDGRGYVKYGQKYYYSREDERNAVFMPDPLAGLPLVDEDDFPDDYDPSSDPDYEGEGTSVYADNFVVITSEEINDPSYGYNAGRPNRLGLYVLKNVSGSYEYVLTGDTSIVEDTVYYRKYSYYAVSASIENKAKNPAQEKWYENSGDDYWLTTDTTWATGKTYYVRG